MAKKLTDQSVRAAPVREKRYSIMDAKEGGLELRIHPNGKKTFALRASVDGIDRRFSLGEYGLPPRMTLEQARGRAAEIKVRLRNEGDFRDAERNARDDAKIKQGFTIAKLADAWLQEQRKHLRDSTATLYQRRIETHIKPAIGQRSVVGLSRAEVRALVSAIGEGGHRRTANAVKQIIASLYRFAANEMEIDVANPAAGLRGFKQEPRSRVLSDDELRIFWAALEDPSRPPGPVVATALKFALFSAQRAGEIAGMRDCELNLTERTWTVPGARTKSGRVNVVPLTSRLLALIRHAQGLRKQPEKGSLPADAPVFQSPRDLLEPIERHAISRGMARLCEMIIVESESDDGPAKIMPPATPHDLRRTARTILSRERLAVPFDIAEALLSHQTGSALSRVYDHHDRLPMKRVALERLDSELQRIFDGRAVEASNNVIPLSAVS